MYYLQGIQSDIYKNSTNKVHHNTRSEDITFTMIINILCISQILTELIRVKYTIKYDEAVYFFYKENYQNCKTKIMKLLSSFVFQFCQKHI